MTNTSGPLGKLLPDAGRCGCAYGCGGFAGRLRGSEFGMMLGAGGGGVGCGRQCGPERWGG